MPEARNVGEGGLREQLVSPLQVGPRAAAHARLAAADALALDISRAGVRSADAVTYAAALRRAGYASAAELDGAGLDAAALSALGIKRGHARLLAVEPAARR